MHMSARRRKHLGDIQNVPRRSIWHFLQFSLQCMELRTPPHFEGGEQINMFWKVFRWVGWVLGPSKWLEARKIGHDIILCRLPEKNIGNLGQNW